MAYKVKDQGPHLFNLLDSTSRSMNETAELRSEPSPPTDHILQSTSDPSETHVFLTTSNVDIRIVRHTSITSSPTSFCTLNFDYSLSWHTSNHKLADILITILDSSGNMLYRHWLPARFAIQCGSHHFNGKIDVEPRYFDVTAGASFMIAWSYLRPKANFKRC